MSYDDFKKIVVERRSIRNFTDQEVAVSDIREIIDCARFAPSDTNSQTWKFIAIRNKEKIKHIEQLTWDQLHLKAAEAEQKGLSREARMLVRSFGPYATAFADAPVLIICLATPYASKFRDKIFDPIALVGEEVWAEEGIKSSCLAAQNIMLAAHAKGLATCPMTGPVLLAQEQLHTYLDIPQEFQINMVISLGYPKEQPGKMPRKEVDEILQIID